MWKHILRLVLIAVLSSPLLAQTTVWSITDMTTHGGFLTLDAQNLGAVKHATLDLTITCNYDIFPCLIGAPYNQHGTRYTRLSYRSQPGKQTFKYRLRLDGDDQNELTTIITYFVQTNTIYTFHLEDLAEIP